MEDQLSALRGSCACGRNRYIIEIPTASRQQAQVLFDNTNVNRWHQASPLTAWLRIPLDWYQSSTTAFFPDETPLTIQRTFESFPTPFAISTHPTRRVFCGYCGTPLSSWNERTRDDANHINVTLGSLIDDDLGLLEELGLLEGASTSANTSDDEEEHEHEQEHEVVNTSVRAVQPSKTLQQQGRLPTSGRNEVSIRGAPWFEDLVENSKLGTLRQRKGGHTSKDGSISIEWEVAEWESTTAGSVGVNVAAVDVQGTGKRKLGDVIADADVTTRSF